MNTDPITPKPLDPRPPRGGWAPGKYLCQCRADGGCAAFFIGDKRANQCADCAYSEAPPVTTKAPLEIEEEHLARWLIKVEQWKGMPLEEDAARNVAATRANIEGLKAGTYPPPTYAEVVAMLETITAEADRNRADWSATANWMWVSYSTIQDAKTILARIK